MVIINISCTLSSNTKQLRHLWELSFDSQIIHLFLKSMLVYNYITFLVTIMRYVIVSLLLFLISSLMVGSNPVCIRSTTLVFDQFVTLFKKNILLFPLPYAKNLLTNKIFMIQQRVLNI